MTARFRIKIDLAAEPGRRFVLKDYRRPAFYGRHESVEAAAIAADNIVRAEHGMPKRVPLTRREIRDAMKIGRAFNSPGVHSHAFGEPNDGCPVCDPLDYLIEQAHAQSAEIER